MIDVLDAVRWTEKLLRLSIGCSFSIATHTGLQPTRKISEHRILPPSRASDSFAFQNKISSDL